MKGLALAVMLLSGTAGGAREPAALHETLDALAKADRFSGAVVIRDAKGIQFARGYGMADPFSGRPFTPNTPVDSASLAKPITAAAVLTLARDGKIHLDSPVQRYLPEYPDAVTKVRHLLAHSAGLPDEAMTSIIGKTNADLLAEFGKPGVKPLFAPGSGFTYCNFCYSTLALLIERVSGKHYLTFVRDRVALPREVTLRPLRLADWQGRAIGYRQEGGKLERADSYEGEAFYGTANFSISAEQLAQWGSEWWQPRLAGIHQIATATAMIGGKPSGLSWGNWYCAPSRNRCHYLGHHEGFHHMLYWDAKRQLSVAMVSNNSMAPAMHQSLQRALVASAAGNGPASLEAPLELREAEPGSYHADSGERVELRADGRRRSILRNGLAYPAYPVGGGIRYVPGLDMYFSATSDRCLRMVTLYEDMRACPRA